MGAVSVFTNGELHPSTTAKAAFRDISTLRITLMGDSPGHSRESEAYNPDERQNPYICMRPDHRSTPYDALIMIYLW